MPLEIERKFLVTGDAWRALAQRSRVMRQGYLVGEGGLTSIRVRIHDDEARLNIKAAIVGSARAEYDYAIPLADAQEIFDTLTVGRVDKTRHYLAAGTLTWEIDEFAGDNAGLIVAEIELSSVDQSFDRPAWLGREVTEEARYYNHALALHPFRTWTSAAADDADAGHRSAPPVADGA